MVYFVALKKSSEKYVSFKLFSIFIGSIECWNLWSHYNFLPGNFSPVFGTSRVVSSHVVDQVGRHSKSYSTFCTRIRSRRTTSKGCNGHWWRRCNEGRMDHVLSKHCWKNWNFMILRNFRFLKGWSVQKLFERGELSQCTERCMSCGKFIEPMKWVSPYFL